MKWVTVRHPVSGGEARIASSAVPQHRLGGWEPAGGQDDPGHPGEAAGDLPEGGAGNSKRTTSRGRAGAQVNRGE